MPWFEDESFWRDLYPYMFPPERLAAASDQVEKILKLTGFRGRTVLDLCSGPGRHAVELALHGFDVTGIDRSKFLLERARQKAGETGVSVTWVESDMRRWRFPQAFDLICNLYTSFGYFEDARDNLRVLRNVRRHLAPGGVLFMEMLGKERLSRVWQSAMCADYEDGALLVQRPQLRADMSRVHSQWILLKDGRYRSWEFEHWVYSGAELKDMLRTAGFKDVKLYGDFEGAPYGVEAKRLIAVARKA